MGHGHWNLRGRCGFRLNFELAKPIAMQWRQKNGGLKGTGRTSRTRSIAWGPVAHKCMTTCVWGSLSASHGAVTNTQNAQPELP